MYVSMLREPTVIFHLLYTTEQTEILNNRENGELNSANHDGLGLNFAIYYQVQW